MRIEGELNRRGLSLPGPLRLPGETPLPSTWVRIRGNRAYLSGHGPQAPDGSVAGPFGQVGAAVSLDEARRSAHLAALSILGTLSRALGDLDRVTAWLTMSGSINAVPGYTESPAVMNACSDLIVELYGDEVGAHARTAIGVAALPLDLPVIVACEVEIDPAGLGAS